LGDAFTGLLIFLAVIVTSKESKRSADVVREIQAAYSDICAVLWRDIGLLLLPGRQADIQSTCAPLLLLATTGELVIAGDSYVPNTP
jgi:hypothetical protein